MKKRKVSIAVRILVIILALFILVCFVAGYIWRRLKTSDYFRISEVICKEPTSFDFSYLKGKNIFGVNLHKESRYISGSCFECKKIRLVRVLPNRIFIDFIKREPLALVKLYKDFAIDEEGVLFHISEETPDRDLPVILGLETKIFGPKSGTKYNIKEIRTILNLINSMKKNRVLERCKINQINIRDPQCPLVFIVLDEASSKQAGAIEIKFPQDDIPDKVSLLGGLIAKSKNDLYNIEYIDLRFTDPVIKIKNDK